MSNAEPRWVSNPTQFATTIYLQDNQEGRNFEVSSLIITQKLAKLLFSLCGTYKPGSLYLAFSLVFGVDSVSVVKTETQLYMIM